MMWSWQRRPASDAIGSSASPEAAAGSAPDTMRGGHAGPARLALPVPWSMLARLYHPTMSEQTPSRILLGLPISEFAFPGPLRDRLVGLVLAGEKVATAGLVADFVVDGDVIPRAGDRSVVVDSDGRPVAIIETTDCRITTLARVDDHFAVAEGEGFADAADWRRAHERFWGSYLDDLRRRLDDPTFAITDSTLVVCERIRLVTQLDPSSGDPIPDPSCRTGH